MAAHHGRPILLPTSRSHLVFLPGHTRPPFARQGVDGADADAVALVARWRAAAAAEAETYHLWRREQLEVALSHARGAPGHAGVHVMPLSARGVADVLSLVSARQADGEIPL
jgi:2-polyprenyl-6-methoxyphenol hydroxylase-like FAD-dependent oxidoreductase